MLRRSQLLTAVCSLALVFGLTACEPTPESTLAAEFAGEKEPAPASTVEQIIEKHFGADTPAAMKIARCESGLNPAAVSRTRDHGLFQINAVHSGYWVEVTGFFFYDREYSEIYTIYAKHLFDKEGWRPWSCKRVL